MVLSLTWYLVLRVRHPGHGLLPRGSSSTLSISAEDLEAVALGTLVDKSQGARSQKKGGARTCDIIRAKDTV